MAINAGNASGAPAESFLSFSAISISKTPSVEAVRQLARRLLERKPYTICLSIKSIRLNLALKPVLVETPVIILSATTFDHPIPIQSAAARTIRLRSMKTGGLAQSFFLWRRDRRVPQVCRSPQAITLLFPDFQYRRRMFERGYRPDFDIPRAGTGIGLMRRPNVACRNCICPKPCRLTCRRPFLPIRQATLTATSYCVSAF